MLSFCLRYCLTVPSISESLRENSVSVLYPGELFFLKCLYSTKRRRKGLKFGRRSPLKQEYTISCAQENLPKFGQVMSLSKMSYRLPAAMDSDTQSAFPRCKQGMNTHFPAIMGTGRAGLIVGCSGCFLLSFGAHCAPLRLLMLRHRRRGICGGESQRDLGWRSETNSKLAEGWEKPAGRKSKPVTVTGWRSWERKK